MNINVKECAQLFLVHLFDFHVFNLNIHHHAYAPYLLPTFFLFQHLNLEHTSLHNFYIIYEV